MGKQKKTTTIRDIAKLANVSLATVSNVLNEKETVDKAIRKKVLQIADELEYSLPQRRIESSDRMTKFIGLIASDITDPMMNLIFKGIENIARIHDYTSILCDSENNVNLEKQHIDSLVRKGINGLLIIPSSDEPVYIDNLRKSNYPFVIVDRRIIAKDVSYVVSDNTEGAYQAVKYLLSLGHRNIVYISGREHITTSGERFLGYQKAFNEWGIPIKKDLIISGDFEWSKAYNSVTELICNEILFTAIFAANDVMAFAAKEALEKNGLRVFNDISLIGYNDIPFASAISLTTVALDPMEMGKNATLLLLDLIDKRRTPPHQIIMKPRLIIRDSCRKIE